MLLDALRSKFVTVLQAFTLLLLQLQLEQLRVQVRRLYQAAIAGPGHKPRLKSHFWADQYAIICVFVVTPWEALNAYLADTVNSHCQAAVQSNPTSRPVLAYPTQLRGTGV